MMDATLTAGPLGKWSDGTGKAKAGESGTDSAKVCAMGQSLVKPSAGDEARRSIR